MNRLLPLSAVLAGLLCCGLAARADQPGKSDKPVEKYKVREECDVTYFEGKSSDAFRHKLDIFVPRDKKDFPTVVLVHGGCWTIGDKSCCGLYSAVGRFLASRGVGVVLPNYRLSPWVKHPEHIKDVARAFAWAHKNIDSYGGDPDRLFIAGHSAGGHLAALLATDEQYLEAEGLSRKNIRGVVAISGVYRIPDKLEFTLSMDGDIATRIALKTNPFDFVFGKEPKGREAASPICHVCSGLPPFLLIIAEHDLPLLPEMAEDFSKSLKEKKCDVELLKVASRDHNNVMFEAKNGDDPVARAILDFVARHQGK
jgi:acetyl esterase/lipase